MHQFEFHPNYLVEGFEAEIQIKNLYVFYLSKSVGRASKQRSVTLEKNLNICSFSDLMNYI
jgi:hypothetical protein